jgi:hypothetical protein
MAKGRTRTENLAGGTAAVVDRERVAARAYELYMARGCGEGHDLDDWLCAERELSNTTENEAHAADDRGRPER